MDIFDSKRFYRFDLLLGLPMSSKSKYYCLSMLLSISAFAACGEVRVHENLFDKICKSTPICFFSKYGVRIMEGSILTLRGLYKDASPASALYQQLCLQAQQDIGILKRNWVPLYNKKLSLPNGANAFTVAGGIYICEREFKELPDGVKRSIMHHEAAHVKYNDNAVALALAGGSFIGCARGSELVMHAALKTLNMVRFRNKLSSHIIEMAMSAAGAALICNRYSKYCERRADIQGALATNCSTCIQEDVKRIYPRGINDSYRDQMYRKDGYLIGAELLAIKNHL